MARLMGSAKDKRTALLPFSSMLTVRIMAVIAFRWFEMSIRSIRFSLDDASPQWELMPSSRSIAKRVLYETCLARFSFPLDVPSDHPRVSYGASACMLRTSEVLRVIGALQLHGTSMRRSSLVRGAMSSLRSEIWKAKLAKSRKQLGKQRSAVCPFPCLSFSLIVSLSLSLWSLSICAISVHVHQRSYFLFVVSLFHGLSFAL